MREKITYTLKDPITVASKGIESLEELVTIKPPRPRDRVNAMVLESIFTKAALSASSLTQSQGERRSQATDNIEKEEDEDKASEGYVQLVLMGASRQQIQEMVNVFGDLLCDGNSENPQATIGETKFTRPIYDELSLRDLKNMLGRYFHAFLS